MSTNDPVPDAGRKLKAHRLLSMLTIVIGVALVIFMIATEDEPGALPLLLIVLGTGWHLITLHRMRSRRR